MNEDKIYLFYGISLHDEDKVVSVYDDPEITINHKIYHLPEDKGEVDLVVHILKSYPFKEYNGKSIIGLAEDVVENLRIYEMQRIIDNPDIAEFYEVLHNQNFLDGVYNPWKYKDVVVMPADDIIMRSVKLGIVRKEKIMKYLLRPSDQWSYHLSREHPDSL